MVDEDERGRVCYIISYGAESGDDYILKKIRKGITTQQVRDVFESSKVAGILRNAYFMLNLPDDTREPVRKQYAFHVKVTLIL